MLEHHNDITGASDADWITRPTAGLLGAISFTVIAVGLAAARDFQLPGVQVGLVLVTPVILCAAVWGMGVSLFCAALGALSFDFFFTAPRFSFAFNEADDVATFCLLLVASVLVSSMSSRLRQLAARSARAAQEAEALHSIARYVLQGAPREQVLAKIAENVERAFKRRTVLFSPACFPKEDLQLTDDELSAARWAVAQEVPARAGEYPFPNSRFDFWPLIGSQAAVGISPMEDARDRKSIQAFLESMAAYARPSYYTKRSMEELPQ